jgi:hypothetical protein
LPDASATLRWAAPSSTASTPPRSLSKLKTD